MTDKKIIVQCDCGCSMLLISKDEDDDYVLINSYRTQFFTEQHGFLALLKKRAKSVWYALCGKDFLLYEIVLNKEKLDELKKFIGEL